MRAVEDPSKVVHTTEVGTCFRPSLYGYMLLYIIMLYIIMLLYYYIIIYRFLAKQYLQAECASLVARSLLQPETYTHI